MALAACSFAPLSIRVGNIELPGNSTRGTICYVEVREQAPARFRNATYTANATYDSQGVLGSNEVTVRVYGRSSPPENSCVEAGDGDLVLSNAFTLRKDERKRIEVGGNEYGGELAALITQPRYWLGASLEGGNFLSLSERIVLENGVVRVFF